MRRVLLLALLALPAAAQPPSPPGGGDGDGRRRAPDPCAPMPQLYLSPMGQPFRAPAGQPYPSAAWFAQADADGDGRMTLPEFLADADRLHARLDTDRDGEIEPEEVARWEREDAPETATYQRGRPLPSAEEIASGKLRRDARYGGPTGAGRWSQLNLPQPVAASDADFNRGVTRDEWRAAAARRFALLGPADGALTLAALKPTPQQEVQAACAARAAKRRR